MKKSCFSLLVLAFLLVHTTVTAQGSSEEACIIVLKGENRNRTVAGAVNTECGPAHSAPFGNWGVDSNYGDRNNTDQFRGWLNLDGPPTKQQWNSCTTNNENFWPPNCSYYNAYSCTRQSSSAVVQHGQIAFRGLSNPCPPPSPIWPPPPSSFNGCAGQTGKVVGQASNYMTLYELDWDGDDKIEKLNFPGTTVTLTGCTKEGCPQRTTDWVQMTSSTSSTAIIGAKLRMKASAYIEGSCGWNW